MTGNRPLNIVLAEKTISRYVLYLLIVLSCLIPSYFIEKLPAGTLSSLMVLSMILMSVHIVKNGLKINIPVILIIMTCLFGIISTFVNSGHWVLAMLKNLLVMIECIFLTILIEKEKEIAIYITAVRDITLLFAMMNLIVGIIIPEGFLSNGYHGYLFGNINGTMRSIMPGICCSLLLDSKNGKKISFFTVLFFISFYYFCFNIYFMATGFIGLFTLILWFFFRKLFQNNYKTAYAIVVIAVVLVEFFVVFLLGNSEYGALIAGLFPSKSGFSGRETLWVNILYFISLKKNMGYGVLNDEMMGRFIGNPWGSHNYYLDVVFQRGYLGLVPLLILFSLPLLCKKRKIEDTTLILLGVCSSYLIMFLMEPFIGTEFLHLPIFCITMNLLMKSKKTV